MTAYDKNGIQTKEVGLKMASGLQVTTSYQSREITHSTFKYI